MKIFLIGMMGSGKTYWMNKLAATLNLPEYDLDRLIEEVEERSIQQIFEESGEEHFRKMESGLLKDFSEKNNFILATGGGAPCFFDNMDWMNAQGITIWLDEPIEALVERLIPEKSHRPLIAKLSDTQLHNYLEGKRVERSEFYGKAKYVLNGDEITEENLLALIKQNNYA